jgi:AcrR family transcriptional regulator
MARHPTPGARQRILDTAAKLFNDEGVRAVGLQQVIDACGCGKSLLYREFPSKDDLVVAWLQQCRGTWDELVARAAEGLEDDPGAQLVAIVAAVAEDVSVPGARGCALRNSHAEFPDPDHPAHRVAVEHVASMRRQIHDIARRTTAADPDTLADRLMLVLDGVYSNGIMLGSGGAAPVAVAFAEDLVRSATRDDAATAAR